MIAVARAEALFASALPTGSHLDLVEATGAIKTAVRRHGGVQGCAAVMAETYGDHPESAARRMRWARQVVATVYHQAGPTRVFKVRAMPTWATADRGTPC